MRTCVIGRNDIVSTRSIYKQMKNTAKELLEEKEREEKAKAEAKIKKQEEDAKASEIAKVNIVIFIFRVR